MFKISGLDGLTRQLDEVQKAADALDGELAGVSFDPEDPASIDAAIVEMEQAVDARVAPWAGNPMVADLADQTKATFRQAILDRAAGARMDTPDTDT